MSEEARTPGTEATSDPGLTTRAPARDLLGNRRRTRDAGSVKDEPSEDMRDEVGWSSDPAARGRRRTPGVPEGGQDAQRGAVSSIRKTAGATFGTTYVT